MSKFCTRYEGKTSSESTGVGSVFALITAMLELSAFQIFFMVLHGAVMIFVASYFMHGNNNRRDNVVPHSELKKRRKKKKKSAAPARASRRPTPAYSPNFQPQEREVREVREVRELLDSSETPTLVGYQLSPAQRKTS